jgi:hypothetical protein
MTAYDELSDDARNLMGDFSELDIAEIAADAQRTVNSLGRQLARAEAERDAAYRERAHLVAWLAALHPSVITQAPDIDEPGWQIVYLTTPTGQMTWHIAPADAALFHQVGRVGPDDPRAQWDGHTTAEKYHRIRRHTQTLTPAAPECGWRLGLCTGCPKCDPGPESTAPTVLTGPATTKEPTP